MSRFFWGVIFLSFVFSYSSEANNKHQKKSSSAVVVGTVYCETCFQQNSPNHFIEGASVAVECKDTSSRKPSFRQEVKTDSHGEFKVHLPFSVSKHVKKIKACSVKLISSNKPYCAVAATATSSTLHLKSRTQGTHIFSAGFFTFRPLKEPEICDQKPSINNIKKLINNGDEKISPISNPNDPTFLPPIRDPPPSDPPLLGRLLPPILPTLPPLLPGNPFLPPLPKKEESPKASAEKTVNDPTSLPPIQDPTPSDQPLLGRLLPPILPRLPTLLPRIPFLPPLPKKEEIPKASESSSEITVNQPESFGFPPNPFNPPSIFPPNPFQPPSSVIPPIFPTPPPSIFPPLLPTPSSPPFFGQLPPFPGLTPSPPPPPPSIFPVPLPPFPFQPTPGFPGVPPAKVSKTSSP